MLRFPTRALVATLAVASLGTATPARADFTFTILHNNDGESALVPDGEAGGAVRFLNLVEQQKASSVNPVMISSGDNFLAGIAWEAGRSAGRYFDAEVLQAVGYDAVILGNHDFDFGPDTLAQFITAANAGGSTTPFISANLDFSAEAGLQDLYDAGTIARSTIVERDGQQIGIVGATTPMLGSISSPRGVAVQDVVTHAQAAIDDLITAGVNKIIFVSHLQSLGEDLQVIPQLSGIDIAIAGGGDELLVNNLGDPSWDDDLLPSDSPGDVHGPYPIFTTDYTQTGNGVALLQNAGGQTVPVVTTSGSYGYLGKLVLDFDDAGNLQNVANLPTINNPIPVAGAGLDTPNTLSSVQNLVEQFEDSLAENVVGTSIFDLDGVRSHVRTQETNLGNLIADAMVWQARQLAEDFNVDLNHPVIGIQNGGGIRNDSVITAGTISQADTFGILPFANFVAVLEDLPVQNLLAALEHAVSRVEFTDGRFAQVSGVRFTYDPDKAAGERIDDVFLDGEFLVQIVEDGEVLEDFEDLLIDLVSIDFLLRDGDSYDWNLADGFDPITPLGVSYREALENYIMDALNGSVGLPLLPYAEGGEGRIVVVPEPATLLLAAAGAATFTLRRRQRA